MPTLNRDELRQVVARTKLLDVAAREGLDAICELYRHFHAGGVVPSCASDAGRCKVSRKAGKLGIFRGQIREAHRHPDLWKEAYHQLVLEMCLRRDSGAFQEEQAVTNTLCIVTRNGPIFTGSFMGTLRAFPSFAALQASLDKYLPEQ